jgi:NAD(P)-dependent dehydrogenase (short-subunit alcohol dehydrogenase family)
MTALLNQDALASFGQRLNIAVVGANGGIGAAIARQLDTSPNVSNVFRLTRVPHRNGASGTRILLDLENEKTIADAATAVACAAESLHLVIVATGVLHDGQSLQPEKSWNALTVPALERAFRINATGPALVAKHFLPLLAADRKTAFAAISARVGSIQENRLGGWYAYRASKAALNMLIKSLSVELARKRPRALCVGLHPGTVDTPLSEPFQRNVPDGALFTPNQAAELLLRVMDSLTPENTGNQFAWDGRQIPA